MACLLGLLGFFFPRLVIVLLAIFTGYLHRAFELWLWPVLGFFFAPLTTLAYALAINQQGHVGGVYLVVLIVAALFDLGLIGGGARRARRKRG